MSDVFFDLSELYLNSGVKFKYYGIARTVMEVAYELTKLDASVRYVIYSPLHRRFFEVFPRVGDASPTGVLDPNIPSSATPLRLRQNLYDRNAIKNAFYRILHKIVQNRNKKRWATVPVGAVKAVDLDGQVLIALGRPKIMSDYLMALVENGTKPIFVPLLHDMIPLHDFTHRNQFSFPRNFIHDNKVAITAASMVLTNSEFTAAEVRHFSKAGILPAVSSVVAVPLCHELRPTNEPVDKYGPEKPYLLCVGIYNGRKNLECVVEAMLFLHQRGVGVPELVLAGARRKRVEKFLKKEKFAALSSKFHFVFNPNQAELRALYEKAYALLLPSRMEGWGLPVSEALWCGTPALAADVPALREAGGDLARYFDPERPEDLADKLQKLLENPADYSELKKTIALSRPQMRTWRDVAQGILDAITPVRS
ncbi:glycosyltransferase family 4 protein [Rhizobium pusense]|uniref:Glycosyltransferase family 4 protein n=1 Tax=Agrobacterium pusense TaxID=648995 RepID=A0A1L9CM39_9HYPH|nr:MULTISPECIES: glycosyltransferase family 1 protein [Rhizobium/Agrobacterium group]ANV25873.1 glycosyl transferase family 1 [Rhizobium sp. S41]KGE80323.1 glycosyl transferase family 1 [Rhizobium sp. H41]KNY30935.1 glycosyl transferase family 1 [Agrobacterium sp. SUL3]MDH0870714.1 glycosyltransferase family 4 protein [Agrobacterium pusense]MDH0909625.1 glycosyltransferase family 4 protein [Agrobacterium pusense]